MKPAQTDGRWRPEFSLRGSPRIQRAILCGALSAGALAGCVASAVPAKADAPGPAANAGDVDPGAKKLLMASGLFNRGMFKPAAQDYEEFLAQNPSHPDATSARYALALCYYRLSDFDKAVGLIDQVLKDPKFKDRDEALAVVGHSQLQAGNLDKSLAAFDELLAKYPKSKHAEVAALNRGQVLYLAKKYAPAADAAKSFLKTYPDSSERPSAMYFLALSQRAQDQSADAAATLTDLRKTFPKSRYDLDATLLLGQSLEAQNKLDDAAAAYRQMILAAPAARAADGHYSLGVVLYKSGKFEDAAREFSAVITDSPDSPYAKPARLQLGLVQLASGKTGDARQTLGAIVAASPGDPTEVPAARYGLAQCDMADKKFDSAKAILEQLQKQTPPPANAPQIALDHAVCLMELKDYATAAQEFAALAKNDADGARSAEAVYREAFCLHKLEKYDRSHQLCAQVASSKSDFVEAAAQLDAENLFLLGNYAEASTAYTNLLQHSKDPDRKQTFAFRLGQCAYHSGDYAKAVTILKPLAENPKVLENPALARSQFLLGDALLQQNKNPEAAAALAKYLPVAQADKQEAQFKLALALLRSGNPAEAQQNLAAASTGPADSPWTARALFESGQLAYKQNPPQLQQAQEALTKVLAAKPPEELAAGATYLLGWIDFDSRKFDDAAAKWATLQTQYPKNALSAEAAYQQGVALREAGKDEPALAALQGYAAAHPDAPHVTQAKQLAAGCLSKLHRPEEAKTILTALASDKTAGDTVLYDLAWAQRDTKDPAGAALTYRRLLNDHPDSKLAPAARGELGELLYTDKEYQEAATLLDAVVKDKSADPKVVNPAAYRLGWCYDKLGKPEQAAAAYAIVIEAAGQAGKIPVPGITDEQVASALLQEGISYATLHKYDEAAKSFGEMLKKFPDNSQASVAMLKLGEVQADAANFDASLQTDTEFLAKFPKNSFAYLAQFGIGWSLENLKKYPEARDAYAKVTAATNGETAARAQFQTGETYLEEGKFEPGITALLAVEDVYAYPKWSARALFEAARAYEQLKQPEQARQQYTQLVTKYKNAPEAALAEAKLSLK